LAYFDRSSSYLLNINEFIVDSVLYGLMSQTLKISTQLDAEKVYLIMSASWNKSNSEDKSYMFVYFDVTDDKLNYNGYDI